MWPIKEEDFKIESEGGEEVLSVYEFAGKVMKHYVHRPLSPLS